MQDKKDVIKIGERYHEVMRLWNRGIEDAKQGYLMMGKAITAIRDEQLWRLEGPHCPTFDYFCKAVLHMSPAQTYRLGQIWEKFGHILEAPEIHVDISKVTLLLPVLANRPDEVKKEMLLAAQDLTVEDLKNNIREMKGHIATDVCEHPPDQQDIETWFRCRVCKKFYR